MAATGPAARATALVGETAVHEAVTAALSAFQRGDKVELNNEFQYLIATS
jgi:hypothetical protein